MWETTLQFLPQMVPAGYTSKMTSKDIYPDKGKFCLPAGMTTKTPFTPSYPELSRKKSLIRTPLIPPSFCVKRRVPLFGLELTIAPSGAKSYVAKQKPKPKKGTIMTYTKSRSKDKPKFLQTATAEQIQEHTDQVRQGLDSCCLPPCSRCGAPPEFFKRHEKRMRIFNIIPEQIVEKVLGLLSRWKCPGCNKTATSYPSFTLPYKRFTLPTIQSFSLSYVQDPSTSYRKLVAACPLVYETSPDSDFNRESTMEHSTIHRWISTMGSYSYLVQTATDLVIQADPATSLHRDLAGLKVSPGKYRSSSRKQSLLSCFHLVFLMPLYRDIFQTGIFPKLATLSGYT